MNFKENIRKLRKDNNVSQQLLADTFGYKSFTTIQKWEDGTAMPPSRVLTRLAEYFNVSIEHLLGTQSSVLIPILGNVRGGPLRFAQQEYLGQELVSAQEASGGEYFYLEVIGDSMMGARIYPGDLVYVKRQAVVENGDIAVVLVGEEATLKRVYASNEQLILQAENPAYPPMIFDQQAMDEKNIQIIGKVIHNKIKFK